MKRVALVISAILLAAGCRVEPDGGYFSPDAAECATLEGCEVGEVCYLETCQDSGCETGVDICCEDRAVGSVCSGEPWGHSSGTGFIPDRSWVHEHDVSADEAWLSEYAGIECAFRVCR